MRGLLWAPLALSVFVQAASAVTTSVSFQNGVDGYTGTFDRRISERITTVPASEFDGSTVQNYFIDGYTATGTPSPDEQSLMRFDGIIGPGAGQIPQGAFILDAQLQLTTSQAGNADSAGPFGVSGLNQAFDSTTSYFANFPCVDCDDLGSRGAWWQDGPPATPEMKYSTRPVGGYASLQHGDVDNANVRSLVQSWTDGATNHGMVIHAGFAGQTNGWSIQSTGNANVSFLPKLSVTYTTDPIELNTFQRDLNTYAGDTMAWVRSGFSLTDPAPEPGADDMTFDGVSQVQAFLDGPNLTAPGIADSADDIALIKFSSVFGAAEGQAPADKPVAKAWIVLTTGDASDNARSNGTWGAFPLLRDWDTTSLYSSFGDTPGLQIADGDIADAAAMRNGMITGSEAWFDLTTYLEAIRTGAPDFGLAIQSTGTADGWQIHFNGSDVTSARPRLVVASALSDTPAPLAGDYNGNNVVDAADYSLWRKNNGLTSGATLNQGDGDGDGDVDAADYGVWTSNFGRTSPGAGTGSLSSAALVPEPSTAILALLVALAATWRRTARQ